MDTERVQFIIDAPANHPALELLRALQGAAAAEGRRLELGYQDGRTVFRFAEHRPAGRATPSVPGRVVRMADYRPGSAA